MIPYILYGTGILSVHGVWPCKPCSFKNGSQGGLFTKQLKICPKCHAKLRMSPDGKKQICNICKYWTEVGTARLDSIMIYEWGICMGNTSVSMLCSLCQTSLKRQVWALMSFTTAGNAVVSVRKHISLKRLIFSVLRNRYLVTGYLLLLTSNFPKMSKTIWQKHDL